MLKDILGRNLSRSARNPAERHNVYLGRRMDTGAALSCSELFNRNDQQEFLLVKTGPDEDGGLFQDLPGL